MEGPLISKTVKVTRQQLAWVAKRSTNFSRYVRSLIDREMGAEEARLAAVGRRQGGEKETTP